MSFVRGAHPVLGNPRVVKRAAHLQLVEVFSVGSEPQPELLGVADMPVPGHYLADAGHFSQTGDPSAVVTHRFIRDRVEQWYLHVRAHVPDDEHATIREEHRAMTWSVRVVHD
jgi:hypothetical protein